MPDEGGIPPVNCASGVWFLWTNTTGRCGRTDVTITMDAATVTAFGDFSDPVGDFNTLLTEQLHQQSATIDEVTTDRDCDHEGVATNDEERWCITYKQLMQGWANAGGAVIRFTVSMENCDHDEASTTVTATIVSDDFTVFNDQEEKFEVYDGETCNIVDL